MSDGKTETFDVGLSRAEYARLEKEARAHGMSVSDYATEKVRRHHESHQDPSQEAACAAIFDALVATGASEITLFLFDFGNQGNHGSVSYKTDLDDDVLDTVSAGLKHLKGGTPFAAMEPVSPEALRAFGESVAGLAPGSGFALFCGRGTPTGYVSNSERSDVVRLLELDVLPHWKKIALARTTVELHEAKEDLQRKREEFTGLLTPEQQLEIAKIEKKIPHLIIPKPTSAANTETILMAFAYLFAPSLPVFAYAGADEAHPVSQLDDRVALLVAGTTKLYETAKKFTVLGGVPPADEICMFASAWLESSFARLEVGHKLAASLCLTDIPDDEVEVRAPWPAWSLIIPDGLLPSKYGPEVRRVWLHGTGLCGAVQADGQLGTVWDDIWWPVQNLIRGACLALSNPDEFKKERHHRPSSHSSNRKVGAPDFDQAKFLLSAPVQIDFREHLREMLSGKRGGGSSPKAQFLVRGHWRNQSHGPHHSLRKVRWIQPFWKGDPEARVLLRQHRVEEPTEP